ncbi:response regulator transcription factor [Kalamiella sp. sgz302252]|uniref:response regulator transcription factor n=1 Tax=Pantoea sp. sgz302252 TaxID=3341827 RepID=UPI0036D3EBE1
MTDLIRRILVVDDHRKIREPLATYLRRHDFSVATAESADTLWLMLREKTFDLIVLDVILPDGDGMQLCHQIQRRYKTPVILLTARDAMSDRVMGLDMGADDYIVKPFEPRELVARIHSVLRRYQPLPEKRLAMPQAWAFSALHFVPATRILSHNSGGQMRLSTMEGKLLSAFLQRPYTVLSREQLIDLCISEGNEVFDRAIDRLVSRLRGKLMQMLPEETLLVTVWGEGYHLAADVQAQA